jgi:LPS O-antigen subunit length determinant protein (WzzB/FepE family)
MFRREPVTDKARQEELESIRQEVEANRADLEHEKDQLRGKLRQIAEDPDPIQALVRALRGESVHVPRRTH